MSSMRPCGGVGTLDVLAKTCSCPLTHVGSACETYLLPACTLAHGGRGTWPPLRPLFWLARVTKVRPHEPMGPEPSTELGPLPCTCVKQLLALGAPFRSRWASMPASFLCAEGNITLAGLLDSGSSGVPWQRLATAFVLGVKAYRFHRLMSTSTASAEAAFKARLLPSHRCPDGCGGAGWCMVPTGASWMVRGSCRCFPEALSLPGGSCARVTHAEPLRPQHAGGAAVDRAAAGLRGVRRAAEDTPMIGRAAGARGHIPLREASSSGVTFNYMRCPLQCSGR